MSNVVLRLKISDIFKGFQIDLRGFYKNRVYVQHHLHIQPSEIDNMNYYEYQWMLKDLVEMLKEQNGEKSENNMDTQMENMKAQTDKYTKGFGGNMPKLGNFSNMKMPKF
jgi:hypothetical protein